MRAALRRLFARRTFGGWFILVVFALWRAIGAWGDAEFFLSKLAQTRSWFATIPSIAAIRAAAAEYLTTAALQWSLLVAGLAWLFLATSSRTVAPPAASEDRGTAQPSRTKRPRKREELEVEVAALLARAYKHGETLLHSNDWTLAKRWAATTCGMIRAAYGHEEADRFENDTDRAWTHEAPSDFMKRRLDKVADLGRRFEFTRVSSDFDPEPWKAAP
jgi:hypothetical protein